MNKDTQAALNSIEIGGENGALAQWVELVPAGPVVGRDGRSWNNAEPQGIITAFVEGNVDLPVDLEHSTELKAPKGEPAPAVGWVKELEDRGGAIWGWVEWNATGRELVEGKQYRYLSPVILYNKDDGLIVGLLSVGLTNRPNLHLQALNNQQGRVDAKEPTMLKKILAALGLPEDATEATALNAIGVLQTDLQTARNSAQTPSLDKFVPRADFEAALNRATTAEAKLAQGERERLEADIETALNQALTEGKIAPASKEFYAATCRAEGGLEQFKQFLASAPPIVGASGLDGKSPGDPHQAALNADQTTIMRMFGNSAEDLAKYGK